MAHPTKRRVDLSCLARRRINDHHKAEGAQDQQGLFKLFRRLSRFKIDNEAHTNAAGRHKFILPQHLRLAFLTHNLSKVAAVHITVREDGDDLAGM